ncbi:granulysin [Tamandua tetradactyla]|uniref:granulysin n=1 Tax=Tamandua tetradactyla TaxID=48850 RepID=UPI004053C632
MAAHAALLLASALLACQGLALSRRTPGRCGLGPAFWCRDLATAHLCAAEELCQGLVPDGPQGDMLTPQEAQVSCWACKKIIQKLQNLVGDQPSQESINQAASRVCSRMGVLKGSCRRILKSFLRRISTDIMEGKDARAICVDLKMCSPKGGLL